MEPVENPDLSPELVKMPELVKQSDLPPEVIKEIEGKFAEMYPGYKVSFAGDAPDKLPSKLTAKTDQLFAKMRDSLINGTCMDCDAKIPGDWPPEGNMPDGWSWYTNPLTDEPMFLVCPNCDSDEEIELQKME